jgi:hypothetical protein
MARLVLFTPHHARLVFSLASLILATPQPYHQFALQYSVFTKSYRTELRVYIVIAVCCFHIRSIWGFDLLSNRSTSVLGADGGSSIATLSAEGHTDDRI